MNKVKNKNVWGDVWEVVGHKLMNSPIPMQNESAIYSDFIRKFPEFLRVHSIIYNTQLFTDNTQ